MYVAVRNYSGPGASELFDLLGQRQKDIEELISGVPGFVSYAAARTGEDTGVTVTVCQAKAGTDESSKRAAAWVGENLNGSSTSPTITEGSTVLQF
jgi:hypothetical protein